MIFQLYDYAFGDVEEFDEFDLVARYDQGNGHTILENADGLVFEVDTEALNALGVDIPAAK